MISESSPVDLNLFEPCFFSSCDWRRPLLRHQAEALASYLAHRVTRNPNDLESHVRRLSLHCKMAASEAVYGALLDLFIALGENGGALRKRFLLRAHALLNSEQQLFLTQSLTEGISANSLSPGSRFSRLSNAISGEIDFIETDKEGAAPGSFTLIDEALDLLDSGHIDEAQFLLENSIVAEPENEIAVKELLSIYRHSRNSKAFFNMKARLLALPVPPALGTEWDELAALFQTNGEGLSGG